MKVDVSTCALELPPHLGGLIASFGPMLEFRVTYTGSRATVTLVYGDPPPQKRKGGTGRGRRRKKPVPGKAQGGTKLVAQPPVALPPVIPPPPSPPERKQPLVEPASPERPYTTQEIVRFKRTSVPPPTSTSTPKTTTPVKRSTTTAPVESPLGLVVPATKRKATSPTTQPAKTKPPPESAPPVDDEWTIAISGLRRHLHQYIQGDTQKPELLRGGFLNQHHWKTMEDGSTYELHSKIFNETKGIVVTHRRDQTYRQCILFAELDNRSIHRMLQAVCGPDYSKVVQQLHQIREKLLSLRDTPGSPK
ncbi:wiskott-Aldrich syndrome protein homolog 1-like [Gigantopelta aegis]|uniref:wiskott-Aldrich syndrome protein homolog 1-like n=1 Tax=Gigantopelta aegis TaxID=1735272 RepID=UPI001B887C94|nr:wiskott-Aldrich syndrome protein homolog 1-like [Gigantopelta aegis]